MFRLSFVIRKALKGFKAIPETTKAMQQVEKSFQNFTLPVSLFELVRLHASQINGCAICVTVHTKEALDNGVTHDKMIQIPVWRHSKLFSEKEKAALWWAEKLTKISQEAPEAEDFTRMKQHFSEKEIIELTAVISSINVWNRTTLIFEALENH